MKRLILSLALWSFLAGAFRCSAADQPLTITIDPLVSDGNLVYEDSGAVRQRQIHFHVVLTNTSAADVRFWVEYFSWGYYALTFQGKDDEGKPWTAKKKPAAFTRNLPAYSTIKPRDSLVIDVYFGDKDKWTGFPMRLEHGTVQAICEVHPDEESKKLNVWTGRIVSAPQPIRYFVK